MALTLHPDLNKAAWVAPAEHSVTVTIVFRELKLEPITGNPNFKVFQILRSKINFHVKY